MNYPGFVGGSSRVRSTNVNAERTLNWYPSVAPGTPKVPSALMPTPCVTPFCAAGTGPIRALFAQNGRCFTVSGGQLYEVNANKTATLRGSGSTDGVPATICSNGTNGHQLFITSGGAGAIYDLNTNTLTVIADPDFPTPVEMGAFSDGFFIALKRRSNQFNISALNDGTSWDGLDVYQVSTVPDELVGIAVLHRELWTFGQLHTSVWSNTGGATTPFQPIGGVQIAQGCGAAYSITPLDNTLFWLGSNADGDRIVYRAKGYQPERISDAAVEYALSQYPRVDDALGFGYQQEGHSFYVLLLPTRPTSEIDHTMWVYDIASDTWHERALWNDETLRFEPHRYRNHVNIFGKHLVGDRSSGMIYELSLDLAADVLVAA